MTQANQSPSFAAATLLDRDPLAAMIRDFHESQHIPHSAACEAALDILLATAALGCACLIRDGAENVTGYFILTFGFSLERGGKTALLDELYIVPADRKRGFGRAAVRHAKALAVAAQCRTLLLEVDHLNPAAHALYTRMGFTTLPRHYLTLDLAAPS